MANIVGDNGNNTLTGTPEGDTIDARGGNDVVHAGDGNDAVIAGEGNDVVDGGGGDDSIKGGGGDDRLSGGDGRDAIFGGEGNDTIDGGSGADTLHGDGGNDIVFGGTGDDSIHGGTGGDQLYGDAGSDTLFGDAGSDTLFGDAGSDTLFGDAGNDRLYGGDGDDVLRGGDGNDILHGEAGNDTLYGEGSNDTLYGSDGDDTIYGGDGIDNISGGAGNDTIHGGADADSISGDSGDDTIYGGDHGDRLSGGAGSDRFIITPGGGNSQVDGGESASSDIDVLDLQHAGPHRLTETGNGSGRVEFLDETGNITGTLTYRNIERVVCFTDGTAIETPTGPRPVEDLQSGDTVLTADNGHQTVVWAGQRRFDAAQLATMSHLRPIRIAAGALGKDCPEHDLLVSPCHRIMVGGAMVELHFAEPEMLIAARHLVGRPGITRERPAPVSYRHILFERHELVCSNGAWTESFQPGDYSLRAVGDAARAEILQIFPELASVRSPRDFSAARPCIRGREAVLAAHGLI